MKKILAVLSVLGIATVLTGCGNMRVDNYQQNIEDFKNHINAYTDIGEIQSAKTKVGKYVLTSATVSDDDKLGAATAILKVEPTDAQDAEGKTTATSENPTQSGKQGALNETNKTEKANSMAETKEITPSPTNKQIDEANKQISTLYSLSSNIDECCQDFTTLKQNITNAILETQNLINKVNSKEIELTNEQKILITEQSKQLKDLGRQLSRATTELSLSLSDLNNLMLNNGDLNTLSLKYLIVLDNLVNGNEMLENGLHSLNLINSMFNTTAPLPPNNTGRILYGFRRNNEEPIIKDYLIDDNGNIKENTDNNNQDVKNAAEKEQNETEATNSTKSKKNIDTMQNNSKMNIDTYFNGNRNNIDSFFNTALLDNEFMYGNGYGYGPMANGGLMYGSGNYFQPYENGRQFYNQNLQSPNYGVNNTDNTQHIEQTNSKSDSNQKSKKFKLTKNVDSYKDENTPTLSTRFGKIKKAVTGFFNKFHKKENPIHHFNPEE